MIEDVAKENGVRTPDDAVVAAASEQKENELAEILNDSTPKSEEKDESASAYLTDELEKYQ